MAKRVQRSILQFDYSVRLNTGESRMSGAVTTRFVPTKHVNTPVERAKAFVRGLLEIEGDWKIDLYIGGEFIQWVCEVCEHPDGALIRVDHAA